MKKLLGIVVLGLLLCNVGFSKDKHDSLKKNVGIKSKDTTIKGWKFESSNKLKELIKEGKIQYVYRVSYAKNGEPVRYGKTSQRFELRSDCTDKDGSDCAKATESVIRSEVFLDYDLQMKNKSEYWVAWSVYIPEDYVLYHNKTGMGQFHSNQGPMPSLWEFKLWNDSKSSGYQLVNSVTGGTVKNFNACGGSSVVLEKMAGNDKFHWCETKYYKYNLMSLKEFYSYRGKWLDFIVNVKWDQRTIEEGGKGFFKLWINGEQKVNYSGQTMHKARQYGNKYKVTFQYGLYNERTPGSGYTDKDISNPIVVYYDEMWRVKSCKKLKLERFGYSCDALGQGGKTEPDSIEEKDLNMPSNESENNNESENSENNNESENNVEFIVVIKNKDDPKYLYKVRGKSKEEVEKKGLMKCKQTYPDLSGSGNTGCYVHYSSTVRFGQ